MNLAHEMLNNVLRKCSSSFLNSQTTVTFSPRLFSQSSYLDQKHNVNKKIVKFKKHHKPKPKKNPPEPERPRSELTEKYQSYVENLILATHDELASIKERERLLAASLPDDILEVRSHVTYHISHITYHISHVTYHMSSQTHTPDVPVSQYMQ